jgi:CDP-diacylglycerol--serine O-phosphatidyltransferase
VKKIAVIPTLLTLGNAVCGFAAIATASKIGLAANAGEIGGPAEAARLDDWYFALSGWLIVGAMIFDALDGYVARLSKAASEFGVQLDSLCDAISFGLAPAFLLLRLGPGWEPLRRLHQGLAVIAALYMVCAILRLARFNVQTTMEPGGVKRFRGLPSPAAAGCLASFALLRGGELRHLWNLDPQSVQTVIQVLAPLGGLTVAFLMVSRLPYPHLTKQILRGRRPFSHLVQVVVALFVIVLVRESALVLLFWTYALAVPLRYLWVRSFRTLPGPEPELREGSPH